MGKGLKILLTGKLDKQKWVISIDM